MLAQQPQQEQHQDSITVPKAALGQKDENGDASMLQNIHQIAPKAASNRSISSTSHAQVNVDELDVDANTDVFFSPTAEHVDDHGEYTMATEESGRSVARDDTTATDDETADDVVNVFQQTFSQTKSTTNTTPVQPTKFGRRKGKKEKDAHRRSSSLEVPKRSLGQKLSAAIPSIFRKSSNSDKAAPTIVVEEAPPAQGIVMSDTEEDVTMLEDVDLDQNTNPTLSIEKSNHADAMPADAPAAEASAGLNRRRSSAPTIEQHSESVSELSIGPKSILRKTTRYPSLPDLEAAAHGMNTLGPYSHAPYSQSAPNLDRSDLATGQPPMLPAPRSEPTMRRSVTFHNMVIVGEAHNPTDYARQGTFTAQCLTPQLAFRIKKELNEFKSTMEVHELSRHHTQFYR